MTAGVNFAQAMKLSEIPSRLLQRSSEKKISVMFCVFLCEIQNYKTLFRNISSSPPQNKNKQSTRGFSSDVARNRRM